MFPPFQNVTEFYPGLFLWCDPLCFGRSLASALWQAGEKPSFRSRDLRPCLVISVDTSNWTFTAAPLSATEPADRDGWIRIDTYPVLTWKLNNAWLWVGPPPVIAMSFNQPKFMHPNKDVYYSAEPILSTNLKHYWVHRHTYEAKVLKGLEDSALSYHSRVRSRLSTPSPSRSSASSSASYSPELPQYTSYPSSPQPPAYVARQALPPASAPFAATVYSGSRSPMHSHSHSHSRRAFQAHAEGTTQPLSLPLQPAVVPQGFTEAQRPLGWWRNPSNGWCWHAEHGLVAPTLTNNDNPYGRA
uniref:Uncharacterized protein n=1 Tax=Mycena chlorophos TaxID=658473 RepID=A0ABQ0M7G0_MYCCL|nr:predicted protein [Mycena chlorophos]